MVSQFKSNETLLENDLQCVLSEGLEADLLRSVDSEIMN